MKDNYQHISAEEIAQDDDFIRYVRHTQSDENAPLEQWLAAHPEQANKLDLAQALVRAVDWPVPELSQNRKDRLWNAIEEGTTTQTAVRRRLLARRRWLAVASVAATILLLVAGSWWYALRYSSPQIIAAAATENLTHPLPDGSLVSLNAVSSITFNANNWEDTRVVNLEGEAFFEVEKGSLFQVKTALGTVEVLGTSFNVEERDGQLTVHCYTGKVRVSTIDGSSVILEPNEMAKWSEGALEKQPSPNQKAMAWRQQLHHFDSIKLSAVFAELERQYDVKVSYPEAISEKRYEGFFESNDLTKALQAICWPMNLQFFVEDSQVVIKLDE